MLTEIKEGFRLSLQQEYLWSLHKNNDSQNYRAQCAISIEGNLNIQVLKMALENIVNRYEILRTNFRYLPGISIPVQAIADNLDGLTLLEKIYDFSDLTSQAQQEIENILVVNKNLPFNFEQESLFNTCLVTLSKQRHLLIISTSAMLVDLSSIRNLIRELSRSYSACLQGGCILEQPLQYVDFAEWQNEILAAAETEIGREYWSKQDFSILGHLKLPRESNIRHKLEFSPRLFTTKISENVVKKIKKVALDYDTSVANFLLACWQTLLWRLTKQENIIIGIACAGREYPELKETIGLFAKNLPMHSHLNEHLSFSQVVQNIEQSLAEIFRWQECFNWQEIIDNTQKFNFCPISFDFESEATKFCEDNLSFSLYQQFICTDKFEVKLSCRPQNDSVVTDFYYDSVQFSLEDIKRLQDQFYLLVESAVENPEAKIDTLNILSDRARNQLLVEFNQTQADYPTDKCIHHLFEEQVRSTPDSIAVVFDDRQLTYKDLNQRANQLAHYLQKLGLQPGTLVGICVERSLLMLVGILGIIKAGGAYVPIDPTYPPARITWILENSQTPFLLTQQLLLATLSQHQQVPKICLDTDWETIANHHANHNQENLALDLTPNNLAYIIYTSGSTGKPKGVRINHRNLVHSTCARLSYYQQPVTRFLLLSSFAFDSSVAGIFWTICQGGTLCLPEEDLPRDIPKLIESIAHNRISHLLCLPSLYALMLKEAKSPTLQSLQTVIVAGESCTQELVKQHLAKLPETNLFNEYGPTENTVWSSVYHCLSAIPGRIPIGKPIANVEIYILDSLLNPVPIQVPGEIYLGGTGIAQGYLDRPQLTAEKFIPHPFSQDLDARLYKTGDIAQYLADGNIEFLGRSDRQVKIRGYRIELEEIELTLNQHPDLQESVVVVREKQTDYQSLVAYGVPHQESTPSIEELRHFLQEKLPNYMIPSVFVLLDNLPLTPNGKIDRQSLPKPEQVRLHNSGIFVAPRTPIEEILVEIWRDLLKVEQISIDDNFFDLGGHSLLTTQLLAKIRETLQIDISLRSLLEAPTVNSLAQNIARVIHPENNEPINPKTLIDFKTEAILDPTIHPENPDAIATETNCIFLTGATGFLGVFLLYELLQQTEADIYCLVRCSNFELGKQKLRSSLESYYLWDESVSSRIIPVAGDLSKPLLGLETGQFQEFASKIDVIYHNGAWVHHIYPYSLLKTTNVLGTQEVLRLASQIKVKPVHFISSSSVFSAQAHLGVKLVREQDELNDRLIPEDGYSQTKWVAEKLVTIAGERGIPVSIYRPSRISGHSQTGVFNQNDFLSKLILGCIQLEAAPDEDIKENIVPVDYVSQAIVRLSSKKTSRGKAFHLVNSQTLHSNMLIEQIRSLGYSLKTTDYQQWRSQLLQITAGSLQHPLYSLIPFFPARETEAKTPTESLEFDCQNTLHGLEGSSIICPPIDQKLLHKYCSYLIQQEIKS